jgi:hypothetical protein
MARLSHAFEKAMGMGVAGMITGFRKPKYLQDNLAQCPLTTDALELNR